MKKLLPALANFLWHPRWTKSHPVVRGLVHFARFPYALMRDGVHGQLNLRAMSLVYTTMLSMVPLIALSFSILKGFNFHYEIEPIFNSLLAPLGDQASTLSARIISFVDNARGAALGSAGLAILIFTVYSMVQKVEESFNFVWQVDKPRNLARKFSDYLSLILVGPILMIIAVSLLGAVSFDAISMKLHQYNWIAESTSQLRRVFPLIVVSTAFSIIYAFLPNTKVHWKAAIVGGFCGGMMWMLAGNVFSLFVVRSSNTTAIYSTFAILFLALVWLYIGWLILLLGAKISFYFQNPQYLRVGRQPLEIGTARRERLAVGLMHAVASSIQQRGQRLNLNQIAKELRITGNLLRPIADRLEAKQLIVYTEDNTLMPALDIDQITLFSIINAVRNIEEPHTTALDPSIDQLFEEVHLKMQHRLSNQSLKSLIETTPKQPS